MIYWKARQQFRNRLRFLVFESKRVSKLLPHSLINWCMPIVFLYHEKGGRLLLCKYKRMCVTAELWGAFFFYLFFQTYKRSMFHRDSFLTCFLERYFLFHPNKKIMISFNDLKFEHLGSWKKIRSLTTCRHTNMWLLEALCLCNIFVTRQVKIIFSQEKIKCRFDNVLIIW